MDLGFWRDLSVVLLCLEGFVLLLIPGAIFFFLVKGMNALDRKLRAVFPKVQGLFRKVNRTTWEVTEKVAAPVIKASAKSAQVKAMGRRTVSLLRRREV